MLTNDPLTVTLRAVGEGGGPSGDCEIQKSMIVNSANIATYCVHTCIYFKLKFDLSK